MSSDPKDTDLDSRASRDSPVTNSSVADGPVDNRKFDLDRPVAVPRALMRFDGSDIKQTIPEEKSKEEQAENDNNQDGQSLMIKAPDVEARSKDENGVPVLTAKHIFDFAIEKAEVNMRDEKNSEPVKEAFNFATGIIVMTNAVIIGVQTDYGNAEGTANMWLGIEILFTLLFIFEAILRVWMDGICNYIKSYWSHLDILCIVVSIVDIYFSIVSAASSSFGILSILRVVRLFRLIRLLRIFRIFEDLYIIVVAFVAAIRSMFWIGLLILIGLFINAIFVTQMIGQNPIFKDITVGGDSIYVRFGTTIRSMYSLFELLTLEGWNDLGRSITSVEPWFVIFFILFILIFTLGLLNMIVGMVVDLTLEHTNNNAEKKKKEAKKKLLENLRNLEKVFTSIDRDNNCHIDFEEFNIVNSPLLAIEGWDADETKRIYSLIKECHLPVNEAPFLFSHLDNDKDGKVTVQEFLVGVLKFRGNFDCVDNAGTHLVLEGAEKTLYAIGRLLNRIERDEQIFMKRLEHVLLKRLTPRDHEENVQIEKLKNEKRMESQSDVYSNVDQALKVSIGCFFDNEGKTD